VSKTTGIAGIVVFLIDMLAVTLGLLSAHRLWIWYRPHVSDVLEISWWDLWLPNAFMPAASVLAVAWFVVLRGVGLYDPFRMTSSARLAAGVSRASVVLLVMAMALKFVMPETTYSRLLMIGFCVFASLYLGLFRLVFFRLQPLLPTHFTRRNIAIVGVANEALQIEERVKRDAWAHYDVIGFLRPSSAPEHSLVPNDRVLGSVADIASVVNHFDVHSVVLETSTISREEALVLAKRADEMGLHVYQVPFTWGVVSPRIDLANLGDLQLIDITALEYPSLAKQTKRVIDLLLVGIGGCALLPFLLGVAAIVKLQDGGPVLFVQQRAGRGGRKFPFYKFRSMVPNAEQLRASLNSQNEADGVLFKMKNDPRVTRFGHFIRKTSIDEFPQLLNVLTGDMNLVGPRPLPMTDLQGISQDPEMAYWFELRSKVKPGITGPWQVSGRSNLGMKDMIQHDIHYIQNWSLWLDLALLARTLPAVVRGRGAK
jgi:exopolysaccharide biosynthesis polyprenyl glycosylphosphotransferase